MHNLILCLCFVFGLFLGFFGWELGLGEAFFHVAWDCLGTGWDPNLCCREQLDGMLN